MTKKIVIRSSLVFGLGLVVGMLIIGSCTGCGMDVNIHIDDEATQAVENAAASGLELKESINDGVEKITDESGRLRHGMDRLGDKMESLEDRLRRMERQFDRMFPSEGNGDD